MGLQKLGWLLIVICVVLLNRVSFSNEPDFGSLVQYVLLKAEAVEESKRIMLSAYTSVPPKIDGVIENAEWSNAASVNFPTEDVDRKFTGNIYVMNDDTMLYIAIRIDDLTLSGREVTIFFDDNHNEIFDVGDDILKYSNIFVEQSKSHLGADQVRASEISSVPDTSRGGTNDVEVAATSDGEFNYFEFSHPLCSDDSLNDFCVSKGGMLGFDLMYSIAPNANWWLIHEPDISEWGHIMMAQKTVTPDWLTMFLSANGYLILAAVAVAVPAAVVIARTRRKADKTVQPIEVRIGPETVQLVSKDLESKKDVLRMLEEELGSQLKPASNVTDLLNKFRGRKE